MAERMFNKIHILWMHIGSFGPTSFRPKRSSPRIGDSAFRMLGVFPLNLSSPPQNLVSIHCAAPNSEVFADRTEFQSRLAARTPAVLAPKRFAGASDAQPKGNKEQAIDKFG